MMKSGLCLVLTLLLSNLWVAAGQQTCIGDIADIYTAEGQVTDTSVLRRYILCPRRIFEIGNLGYDLELKGFNVQPPLPLRPNMIIQCGDTGSRDELCWLTEGDLHMDATAYRGITDATVENVVIKGVVFISSRKFSLWADKPGSITFQDCEFRDFTKSVTPIYLDWFDANSNSMLDVTFEDCWFHGNEFFGFGSHTSLIYSNSAQSSVSLQRTLFSDNDMVRNNTMSSTSSFIVESLGPVTVENSCFQDNSVGVSNIAVFGSSLTQTNSFISNSTGAKCSYASVFQTLEDYDRFTPSCVDATATTCMMSGPDPTEPIDPTLAPAPAPTLSPTTMVTPAPVVGTPAPIVVTPSPSAAPSTPLPTSTPTVTGSPTVTAEPTPLATESPSGAPTPSPIPGTSSPVSFVFPTDAPTGQSAATSRSFVFSVTALVGWFVL